MGKRLWPFPQDKRLAAPDNLVLEILDSGLKLGRFTEPGVDIPAAAAEKRLQLVGF